MLTGVEWYIPVFIRCIMVCCYLFLYLIVFRMFFHWRAWLLSDLIACNRRIVIIIVWQMRLLCYEFSRRWCVVVGGWMTNGEGRKNFGLDAMDDIDFLSLDVKEICVNAIIMWGKVSREPWLILIVWNKHFGLKFIF